MKKILNIIFLSAALILASCGDQYDDARIKQDIGEIEELLSRLESQVDGMNAQMAQINTLVASNFISFITKDANGNYVISYKEPGGEIKKITIATSADVVSSEIIGIGESEGKYYWRYTADMGASYDWALDVGGDKIPVGGTLPVIGLDPDGYWTIDGVQMLDKNGKPVLGHDLSDSIFRSVEIDAANSQAVFTLADGSEVRLQMFEALGITFDKAAVTAVPDRSQAVRVKYTLHGTDAADAMVDFFTAYNVTASVDSDMETISVTLDAGAESGNVIVLAHANGNTILKPLFFTYGSAEIAAPQPDAEYVQGGEIVLPGELTSFDIRVSASIDYEISVSNDAKSWLIYNSTRAMTTLTHTFTADHYENASGASRSGAITFANRPYGISVTAAVKQNPAASQSQNGISTPADLLAFAEAVNAGAGTSRWQDETGAVVLLNDIDMSAVDSWRTIGKAKDNHTPVNPFTGTFNGMGFAIYGMNWTFDVSLADHLSVGLFGSLKGATITNLALGKTDGSDTFTFTGTAVANTALGALAGYIEDSRIEGVTNYVNMHFTGEDPSGLLVMMGGLIGSAKNSVIGGGSKAKGSVNYGNVVCGKIANEANGGTGMNVGGICGFVKTGGAPSIEYCVNNGDVSAPTGRGGGIVGTLSAGTVANCENKGLVRDDIVGQYTGKEQGLTYNVKRMGGIVGGTANDQNILIEGCTNSGNVYTSLSCRTGGIAGHNNGRIRGCVNKGVILGDVFTESGGVNKHGPGWLCGYSSASSGDYVNASGCVRDGKVGSWTTYKDNPSGAPDATNDNAFCHKPETYDPNLNN